MILLCVSVLSFTAKPSCLCFGKVISICIKYICMQCLSKSSPNKPGTLPGFVLHNPQSESESKRFKYNHLLVHIHAAASFPFSSSSSSSSSSVHKSLSTSSLLSLIAENKCKTSTLLNVFCSNYISSTNYSYSLCFQALWLSSSDCSCSHSLLPAHTHTHIARAQSCAWTHTCVVTSWRWGARVGTRCLMEAGRTHSEYWWDAVRVPLTWKSDKHTQAHARSHAHAHNNALYATSTFVIPVMTSPLLHLSLTYFDVKSIVPTTAWAWSSSLLHWDSIEGDSFTPPIQHSIMDLSSLKACWMCFEWGW